MRELPFPLRRAHANALPREEWLLRSEAALLLGMSKASVRRLERELLVTEVDGVHYLSRAAVEAAARAGLIPRPRELGRRTAAAWAWFEREGTIADVVLALRASIAEAESLRAAWERARVSSSMMLPTATRARLADAGVEVATLDQLVEVTIDAIAHRR
jgi:hypothetical protein